MRVLSVNNEVKHINHRLESLFFLLFVRYIFDIRNGLETVLKRRWNGPALRLPAPSLRGRAGGEAVCLFCFLMQSYSTFPTQSFQLSDFSVKIC